MKLGDTGPGIWIAYAAIVAFIALIVGLFLRTAFILSFLWLYPVATVFRRVPGMRRVVERMEARFLSEARSAESKDPRTHR